jgi:AAHS family 4-hydroxybenzoate transporter-like MFS transporter
MNVVNATGVVPDAARYQGATRTIDILDFINQRKVSRYQILIFVLCFVIMCLDGYDTVVVGYIAPMLAKQWGLAKPQLAPMFGAGLFGLTLGSFLFGPLADKYGRKTILIVSITFFGIASLLSALATDLTTLTWLRFITGLGLGGAMPNTYTMAAEFSPDRLRSRLVAPVGCGIAGGGAIGGLFASTVIGHWGWQGMLVLGGILPLLLVPFLLIWLPESIRYQVQKDVAPEKIAATLNKIDPTARLDGARFTLPSRLHESVPIKALFEKNYGGGTILLWITAFMALLVIYFLGNWLPILIHDAGVPIERASLMTAIYLTGNSLGAIVLGFFMDRFNPQYVLAIAFAIATVSLASFGFVATTPVIAYLALLGTGIGTGGTMTGTNVLSTGFYPTLNRATGTAWTLAMGRVGSVVGSLIGGLLIAAKWGTEGIFLAIAVPVFLGGLSMCGLAIYRAHHPR